MTGKVLWLSWLCVLSFVLLVCAAVGSQAQMHPVGKEPTDVVGEWESDDGDLCIKIDTQGCTWAATSCAGQVQQRCTWRVIDRGAEIDLTDDRGGTASSLYVSRKGNNLEGSEGNRPVILLLQASGPCFY